MIPLPLIEFSSQSISNPSSSQSQIPQQPKVPPRIPLVQSEVSTPHTTKWITSQGPLSGNRSLGASPVIKGSLSQFLNQTPGGKQQLQSTRYSQGNITKQQLPLPSYSEMKEILKRKSVTTIVGFDQIANSNIDQFLDSPGNTGKTNQSNSNKELSRKAQIHFKSSNLSRQRKQTRQSEIGGFVEFSKVGPARNVECYQTRTHNLFNIFTDSKNSPQKQSSKTKQEIQQSTSNFTQPIQPQPPKKMEIYSGGTPLSSDITSWQAQVISPISSLSNPKAHSGFTNYNTNRNHNAFKNIEQTACKIAKSANIELEQDCTEQSYKLRSNLKTVIDNLKGIHLAVPNSPSSVSSKHQTLDDLDGNIQNDHNNNQHNRPLIKSESTYSSNPYLPIRTNPSMNFPNSISNLMGSSTNNISEGANFKSNRTEGLKTRIYSLHQTSNTLKDLNPPIGSDARLASHTSFGSSRPITAYPGSHKSQNELLSIQTISYPSYSIAKNITTANYISSPASKTSNTILFSPRKSSHLSFHQFSKGSPSRDSLHSYLSSQPNNIIQPKASKEDIDKKLTLKAYSKAISEFKRAELEDDKLMFDPNSETIKKKRKAKEKLKRLLLLCSRLKITYSNIESVAQVSTIPYQNKGSFVFLECVKKNQINTVLQYLEKNKYYVSDFDQFRMTGLHYSCKKGHIQMSQILIQHGSDLEAVDSMGRTPLYYALVAENKEILKELIQAKCSPWSADKFSFLRESLPKDILDMMKFAKRADISYRLTQGLERRRKIKEDQSVAIQAL